ncbi:MAG: hypothetical protein F4Y71_11265 [Acidobacteria bacterium]|nr:hypothetical protein [Acidobacteriota bacterium]MYG74987.1 hypothetical protein [Acidobacteriota bacterium]
MSRLARFLLAATAFAPALLTYSVVSLMNADYRDAAVFLAVCLGLVLACDGLMQFGTRRLATRSYETATVETADGEVFGVLLVYLLPLITRDLATYNWVVWILVTSLFCLVVAASHGFHFNPLLIFLQYHFYKVTEQGGIPHVLITRRRIYKLGESLTVARLGDYLLVEPPRATTKRAASSS